MPPMTRSARALFVAVHASEVLVMKKNPNTTARNTPGSAAAIRAGQVGRDRFGGTPRLVCRVRTSVAICAHLVLGLERRSRSFHCLPGGPNVTGANATFPPASGSVVTEAWERAKLRDQGMCIPEAARAMTRRWISEVPSKSV